MSVIPIPTERFLLGNEHWRSYRAIDEIGVYCDLLDVLQDRIDSLQVRGKDEEVTLFNVQAVISRYAFEIAMKSLWALDNSPATPPRGRDGHNLLIMFDDLKKETVESLGRIQLTKEVLKDFPSPFLNNRYSMEASSEDIVVYKVGLLRSLAQLLRDKLDQTRKEMIS